MYVHAAGDSAPFSAAVWGGGAGEGKRTRGQTLLELLGLVRVLEDERVQVAVAADLEFGLVGLGGLLYPGSCFRNGVSPHSISK